MLKTSFQLFFCLTITLTGATPAFGCSCSWGGGFLKTAPQCPLIIRGTVIEHSNKVLGKTPAMVVQIKEVLQGTASEQRLLIRGDNGMLCRIGVEQFTLGNEYILALNGPGSKPAYDGGPAISSCGQYWLEVQNGKVIGAINPESSLGEKQELKVEDFLSRLTVAKEDVYNAATIYGEVKAGEEFSHQFGSMYQLRLLPQPLGWLLSITEDSRLEDLSRLTPPWHGSPNPRELEGWHLRNSENTGPNEPGAKNINAPGLEREFIFSPEVGRTIDGPNRTAKPTTAEVAKITAFGKGTLSILDYRLTSLEPYRQAGFEWLKFKVDLRFKQQKK